ncbi:MAG: hypothetical protein LQ348_005687 [Seirophora lacunosa]|nr:MAG: hypothetical protein LQ348_005687 [Seirophora lacunosa]
MPLNHVSLTVPPEKMDPMAEFLTASLQHLGFREHIRFGPYAIGMGEETAYFWLAPVGGEGFDQKTVDQVLKKQHIAFTAETIEQVQQFHAAALKAGATDNGPPGLRPQYHKDYYGAFVLDPLCGVNFEVMCHLGGDASKHPSDFPASQEVSES